MREAAAPSSTMDGADPRRSSGSDARTMRTADSTLKV